MDESERDAFNELWTALKTATGHSVTPASLVLDFETLRPYSLDGIRRAMIEFRRDPDKGALNPQPADIIRHIAGSRDAQSLAAWNAVHAFLVEYAPYASAISDDPLILTILDDLGGIEELYRQWREADDPKFVQRDFQRRYEAYLLVPPHSWPGHLPGYYERVNRPYADMPQAVRAAEPRLIGRDREKALAIRATVRILEDGRLKMLTGGEG